MGHAESHAVKAAVYQAVVRIKTHIGADKIRHKKVYNMLLLLTIFPIKYL